MHMTDDHEYRTEKPGTPDSGRKMSTSPSRNGVHRAGVALACIVHNPNHAWVSGWPHRESNVCYPSAVDAIIVELDADRSSRSRFDR